MDFMGDNFADGRRFRVLNILDVYSKESLAIVVDTSINGEMISTTSGHIVHCMAKHGQNFPFKTQNFSKTRVTVDGASSLLYSIS